MSRISLTTRHLVELLEDALETAGEDPEVSHQHAVLLHTERGDWTMFSDSPDEGEQIFSEGETDLLAASSLTMTAVGQGHVMCDGQLRAPLLISVPSAKNVIKVMKPLITRSSLPKKVTHRVVLNAVASTGTLEVTEDPDLVEDATAVVVPLLEIPDFYPRRLGEILTPDRTTPVLEEGREVPVSYGTGLEQGHLAAVANVANRHKMPIRWYRYHQKRRIRAEVGTRWVCVFLPVSMEDPGWEDEPVVQVFTPDLPVVVSDPLPV